MAVYTESNNAQHEDRERGDIQQCVTLHDIGTRKQSRKEKRRLPYRRCR
jgi:hypothetical protein